MDPEQILFESNRPKLKKIFLTHARPRDITMDDLLSFCKNAGIFPEILTAFELKRLVLKITQLR